MKNLKDYAKYLRENCLKEYAIEYINILKSLDIPLLKLAVEKGLIKDIGDEESIERTTKSQYDYFLSIEDGSIYQKANINLRNWEEDKIPGIRRNEILPSDLILIYVAQKKAILKFLPRFIKSSEEAASIITELETCYMTLQDQAMKLLFKIQQETERQLRTAEEQFRLMVKNAKDYAMLMLDTEGNIQTWNEGAERIKGYKAEEVIGKPISIFYTEEDNKKGIPAHNLKVAREKGDSEVEGLRVRKDGSTYWADTMYTSLYDDDGKLNGFFKVTRNITPRKKAEGDLKELNNFLDSVLENIPNMVFVKDAKDLKFVRFNRAGEKLLGYSKQDLLGKNDYDFFPKEQADFFVDNDKAVLGQQDIVDIPEEPIDTKRGTRWLHTRKIPIMGPKGNPEYLLGISEDITEIRNAQLELEKKTKELERSNTELEQFAYVASHDLQEPLRTVSSYVQLLASRYHGKLDKDADEFIDFAVDGSKRMRLLIQSLLEYSRVNRVKPFEWVDVNNVLDEVMLDMQDQIKESGAKIIHNGLPKIHGDVVLIGQLFQNLIGNAIKFRGDEIPEIHISAKKQNDKYLFSVKDNGIGMLQEYGEKIFVIFQRLNNRNKYPGTGIGLSICKKIVERHGGKIWVESEPGKGSNFFFTIKA
ncbi:MAG TPA: PAS domain S-box protein [Bacteroidia bacterium]|nr:PAS domain S-box protein [Bacteroidia bacterium]